MSADLPVPPRPADFAVFWTGTLETLDTTPQELKRRPAAGAVEGCLLEEKR